MQEPMNQNEPAARSIADHLYTLMQQYDPKFMQQYQNREVQVSETEHAIRSGDLNAIMHIEMLVLSAKNDEQATPALRDQAANLLQEIDTYKESNHTFSIYQVKNAPENRDYLFQPYDKLQEKGIEVDPDNYDLIYTAPLPDLTTLEDIYRIFNLEQPDDFTGRSLSVSDIVVEKFSEREIAYYCDMYGFTEVPEFLEKQKQHGAKSFIESELKAAGINATSFDSAEQWEKWMEAKLMGDRSAVTKTDELSVLVVEPGREPYAKRIGSDLKSLQNEVGGYIEAIYPFYDPVALICNEEGKINGLPLNRALRDEKGKAYDIISGTFMVAGLGEENFSSLSDDLMEKYTDYFKAPERFIVGDGKIVVLKPKEPEPTRMADQLAAARSEADKQGKEQGDPQNRNEQDR